MADSNVSGIVMFVLPCSPFCLMCSVFCHVACIYAFVYLSFSCLHRLSLSLEKVDKSRETP